MIAQGKEQQALETVQEFLPFLGILGLFCHAHCEKACVRSKIDGPVKIRALHRYLAENESQFIEKAADASKSPSGKSIAIWGSGPSGLMAAWRLSRNGHRIVVFESGKELGGTLRNDIFTSQIHHEAISAMMNTIIATGIEIRLNTELGKDVTFNQLLSSYDAVVITYKDDLELSSWLADAQIKREITLRPDLGTLQVADQKKIFACRDISDKGTLLANALAMGRTASESAHRFLSKEEGSDL